MTDRINTITTTPDPLTAKPGDDIGFTDTIEDF